MSIALLFTQWLLLSLVGLALQCLGTWVMARAFLAGWLWRYPDPAARQAYLARNPDARPAAESLKLADDGRWNLLPTSILPSFLVAGWLRGVCGLQEPPPHVEWSLSAALAGAIFFGFLRATLRFQHQCLRESSAGPEDAAA